MNKPLLLCLTHDDRLVAEFKKMFSGSPFSFQTCQTPAAALTTMQTQRISMLVIDFHPLDTEPSAFLRVLSEAAPTLPLIAVCRDDDLRIAIAAQNEGKLSGILSLPLDRQSALAVLCRAVADSALDELARELPAASDKILAAESKASVLDILSDLLVRNRDLGYASLSPDLHLAKSPWHSTLFSDSKRASRLDADLTLTLRLAGTSLSSIKGPKREDPAGDYDSLSGVFNRAGLLYALKREVERVERYGTLLALMVVDLDGFAEINNTYGRQTGDRVLKGLGTVLDGLTRRTDVISRPENDEFCLLLPGIDLDHAAQAAYRVQREVASWTKATMTGVPVSLSVGIAAYQTGSAENEQAIGHAHEALNHARSHGKANVGFFDRKPRLMGT